MQAEQAVCGKAATGQRREGKAGDIEEPVHGTGSGDVDIA